MEKDADGATQRGLMCETDGVWQAKSRVKNVEAWELPDLGEIIAKTGGAK